MQAIDCEPRDSHSHVRSLPTRESLAVHFDGGLPIAKRIATTYDAHALAHLRLVTRRGDFQRAATTQ